MFTETGKSVMRRHSPLLRSRVQMISAAERMKSDVKQEDMLGAAWAEQEEPLPLPRMSERRMRRTYWEATQPTVASSGDHGRLAVPQQPSFSVGASMHAMSTNSMPTPWHPSAEILPAYIDIDSMSFPLQGSWPQEPSVTFQASVDVSSTVQPQLDNGAAQLPFVDDLEELRCERRATKSLTHWYEDELSNVSTLAAASEDSESDATSCSSPCCSNAADCGDWPEHIVETQSLVAKTHRFSHKRSKPVFIKSHASAVQTEVFFLFDPSAVGDD